MWEISWKPNPNGVTQRERPGMRTLARVLVFLSWAAVMVVLFRREHAVSEPANAPPAPLPAGASEEWQGVYGSGKKIGWAHSRRIPTADGFDLENDARVAIEVMGASRVLDTRVTAATDAALHLRRFDFRLVSEGARFAARGTVVGGGLEVELASGDSPARRIHVPLAEPIVLPQTLHDVLAREALAPGRTLRYALFDPATGSPASVELRVGAPETVEIAGETHTALRVVETFHGSEFELWIDRAGRVLKERGPLGLTLVRESAETATAGFDARESLDLVALAAIPADRAIPSPRGLARLRLRVAGAAAAPLSFPPRQEANGNDLRIERDDLAAVTSYPLPASDPRFAADLAPTPFLESDDPEVRALARSIARDGDDALAATRRLVEWVFRSVAKVPTVGVPTALGVLRTKRGDCNEHAVLFAALARAAGLPARVVAGTVYLPGEADQTGAFFYHAWSEVWLGRWVAVDPTFGQVPADATHVELVEGGPEKHADLLRWIGRLRFGVAEFG